MKNIIFLLILTVFQTGISFGRQDETGSKVEPSPGRMHAGKAKSLVKVRNYQGALIEFDKAISKDPGNFRFWLSKANVYAIVKDPDNAISCLEKVIELKPDYVKAYLALNTMYQRNKKFEKSIAVLDKAYKYETDIKTRVKMKAEIVKILQHTDKFHDAGPHLSDLKGLAPQNLNVLYYDAVFSNMKGDHDTAIQSASDALSLISDHTPQKTAQFFYELGYAHHRAGNYGKADEALVKANYGPYKSRVFKLSPAYYYTMALSYYKVFEFEKSEELLDIALQIRNNYPRAHNLKIKIAEKTTDKSGMIESLQAAVDSEKDVKKKVAKLEELAESLFESGKYQEARVAILEALGLLPNNPPLMFLNSVIQKKSGNAQIAAGSLTNLVRRPGLNQDVKAQLNFALGLIYEGLPNQEKLAASAFKKATFGSFRFAANEKLKNYKTNK